MPRWVSSGVTDKPMDAAFFRTYNTGVVEEFRANAGKVGGQFEGRPLLLLTTTGVKTAMPRVSPLAYFTIDGKLLIVGSFAGNDVDPAWVRNLRANPRAHIEIEAGSSHSSSSNVKRVRVSGGADASSSSSSPTAGIALAAVATLLHVARPGSRVSRWHSRPRSLATAAHQDGR